MEDLIKVTPIQNEGGTWYIIPSNLREDFVNDENQDFIESGGFEEKYNQYCTGGDLNIIQFYVKKKDLQEL